MNQLELNFDRLNKQLIVVDHRGHNNGRLEYHKYDTVADVYVDNELTRSEQLEKAFMLTQNIDDGWWHNDDVKKRSKSDAVRSTSVGDRMKINGDIYMVDLAGFRKINNL